MGWREGASLLGREATRAIENGHLRLRNRSVGFTGSDSGSGANLVLLGLPDPQAAGYMRATVTATNANDVGCSGNTTPTQSFVGLVGSFFNAGTPTNGDATDDVIAAVGISSDSDKIAASQSPEVVFRFFGARTRAATRSLCWIPGVSGQSPLAHRLYCKWSGTP
jgi:hypothetical protein